MALKNLQTELWKRSEKSFERRRIKKTGKRPRLALNFEIFHGCWIKLLLLLLFCANVGCDFWLHGFCLHNYAVTN